MPIDLKAHCRKRLEDSSSTYLQDWDAMPGAVLCSSPGSVSRSPIQFTYEMAVVNQRLATRMVGGDPGPFDPGAFAEVPAELSEPNAMRAHFVSTMDQLFAALDSLAPSDMDKEIPIPSGTTSPFDLATFAATHITYHDGQLNLIQTLNGDSDIHWS